jgi:mono/diheme cytochrome c family protein
MISALMPAQKKVDPQEDPKLIDSLEGRDLFRAYCAVCHGTDAKGSGPMAGSLKTGPADLTKIAARNQGQFPFVRVQRIISGDEAMSSSHGPREMPIWGPVFSVVTRDQDFGKVRIYNLARYLEGIQVK